MPGVDQKNMLGGFNMDWVVISNSFLLICSGLLNLLLAKRCNDVCDDFKNLIDSVKNSDLREVQDVQETQKPSP